MRRKIAAILCISLLACTNMTALAAEPQESGITEEKMAESDTALTDEAAPTEDTALTDEAAPTEDAAITDEAAPAEGAEPTEDEAPIDNAAPAEDAEPTDNAAPEDNMGAESNAVLRSPMAAAESRAAITAAPKVTAKASAYNEVTLSWTLVANADYYRVYRSTSANGTYVQLGTYDSKTTSSVSRQLGCGTTYYYKIRPYQVVNSKRVFGPYSNVVSAKPVLKAPQNVQAKPDTYNTVKLSWNKVDGANYYQVYRSTSTNGKYVLLGTYDSNTTSSVSRQLGCGTTYYYKIRAYRWVSGNRVFSSFSSVKSAKPYLKSPTGVTATPTSKSTVQIKWAKTAGADYYQVYRATSPDGKYALLGVYDSKTSSSVSKALKSGTTYYYKVRGYRWVGGERVFSSFSSVASATPYPVTTTTPNMQEVVRLVNVERQKAGLSPLTLDKRVEAAANVRAKEICEYFSHTRPNGTSCFTALDEVGAAWYMAGENIAAGFSSPAAVMNGWMNSQGHRENILTREYTGIGVGCYKDASGRLYWVQLFVTN